jgi:hypothetical protein
MSLRVELRISLGEFDTRAALGDDIKVNVLRSVSVDVNIGRTSWRRRARSTLRIAVVRPFRSRSASEERERTEEDEAVGSVVRERNVGREKEAELAVCSTSFSRSPSRAMRVARKELAYTDRGAMRIVSSAREGRGEQKNARFPMTKSIARNQSVDGRRSSYEAR